jgi:hypothetical protein
MTSAAVSTVVMSEDCVSICVYFSLVSVFSFTPGGPILKTNETLLEILTFLHTLIPLLSFSLHYLSHT